MHGVQGIDGARVEKVLDLVSITLNKNSVPGDKSAVTPGGVRIGSPALTTRGFKEADFVQVAELIHEAVQLTIKAKASCPGPKVGRCGLFTVLLSLERFKMGGGFAC
jgi:glycine hydroxymethyltransferase